MKKHAVFVDAGYLLGEGSRLLAGRMMPRAEIEFGTERFDDFFNRVLDYNYANQYRSLVSLIKELHASELLRIYWYDSIARNETLTPEQSKIAESNHFKFRYGYMNAEKKQKRVDALITTDMIELARNKSITDAVLITGDEDLILGLQIAQTLGIRCHLIGIDPIKNNQSTYLRREADSAHIWGKEIISQIITFKT